ncbi:MAG: hypothetical protein WDO74_28185 [Pseudomonadota bacterium]
MRLGHVGPVFFGMFVALACGSKDDESKVNPIGSAATGNMINTGNTGNTGSGNTGNTGSGNTGNTAGSGDDRHGQRCQHRQSGRRARLSGRPDVRIDLRRWPTDASRSVLHGRQHGLDELPGAGRWRPVRHGQRPPRPVESHAGPW